jgi:large subunit ribosomal protein L22
MSTDLKKSASAIQKFIYVSPRKTRLIADLVRGKSVAAALATLKFVNTKTAPEVAKVIKSAASNLRNKFENENFQDSDLVVRFITIDGGPMLKRVQPAPQGRAYTVLKRSSHINVTVEAISTGAQTSSEE